MNDAGNPTGYAKVVEEKTSQAGAPIRSFVLGLRVEGQSTAATAAAVQTATQYMLTDGHGSTRALVSLGGTTTARYDYDAFGAALDFDAASAATPWLLGGDGVYDAATGWTYQLARWRDGDRFASYDSFQGDLSSPSTLHKYNYAGEDPVSFVDPTGHFELLETLETTLNDVLVSTCAEN